MHIREKEKNILLSYDFIFRILSCVIHLSFKITTRTRNDWYSPKVTSAYRRVPIPTNRSRPDLSHVVVKRPSSFRLTRSIIYWASLKPLPTQGRKRLAFTIKQKMKIIQEIERGKSKSDVARELGLASSTVATIWKNRESIAESWRNRDMMQQSDVEDVPSKKPPPPPPPQPSMSSSLASTTLCTPAAMTMTTTTTITTTPSPSASGVVVVPPQMQVVPPVVLPPPPPPYPTLNLPPASAGLTSSTQPTVSLTSSLNPSSTTTSTGTTTTINVPPDNIQQAQTQTQNQELLEVRCRMTHPPNPPFNHLVCPDLARFLSRIPIGSSFTRYLEARYPNIIHHLNPSSNPHHIH